MDSMIHISTTDVLLSLVMIALAIGVSRWWKIPVQKDMALGSVRAFVQLVAVGYALKNIFELDHVLLIVAAILVMIVVGSHAAGGRVKGLRRPYVIAFISMVLASAVTLAVMLGLRIVPLEARYIIPLAGMIVGNSMNASALTANRISSDLKSQAAAVEASLALGKSWRAASLPLQKEAAVAGMLSTLNFLKTVGLVALPGAMTGMILAGAEPLQAVLFQFIVGAMLLSAVTVASIATLELTVRRFFTANHQLIRDNG